ncbi:glycosyltransferase family 4 protein [Sphingomonas sp. CROZ-RG-20F-R02-07]|uniref:glycosyltransferase family 4 protein n=1 Tax=Sphingomonas sp. CROZ-RG-20F-R02-07 TaxID=2914832 RepID=UPI001F5856BB
MVEGRAIILSDYAGGDSAASGGAGHAVRDHYSALRDHGVDVRLVSGFAAGEDADIVSLGGADLREGGRGGAIRTIYNPAARRSLGALLADEDPERTVVILHQWTRYLSPAAIGLLAPFRTMIYMHDYFWPCPNGAYYDFVERRPCDRRPLGLRCVAADCDRAGRLHKLGRLARHVALRGVTRGHADRRLFLHLSDHARRTAEPLLPGERHADVRNWLAIPAAPPPARGTPRFDIGYFGRLEPEKGVSELADAAVRLGLSGYYVGTGSLVASLAERPGQHHRRWRPRAEMTAAMRACRVVVLPSRWPETWGLIVPEAMAAGVPVVVSMRAGSAELVQRFGGGATFDPAVPGDLDRALLEALTAGEPVAADRWPRFARYLSAERHADRIVALAAQTWAIDLRPAHAPRPVASESLPGVRQPLAT